MPAALERRGALARLALDDVAGPPQDRRDVDLDRGDPHAEPAGLASKLRDLGAAQHHLRRHAPVVGALAAQPVALGQRHPEPRAPRQPEGDLRSRAPAADHEDVEPLRHEPPRNPTKARA